MDLDSFFVSVERLYNKDLLNKAVIIGSDEGRGVVASCSYEARKKGVHSAMPVKIAKQLCPEAIIVRGNMERYSLHSLQVTEIIAKNVPLFEKSSIDEFYLDLSGLDKFFGSYQSLQNLRNEIINKTQLPISCCLANSKTVAKIGTSFAKPNGSICIEPGTEAQFLAPLSIAKMPMLGKVAQEKLGAIGIKTLGELSKRNPKELEQILGKVGPVLWEKSQGICNSLVEPFREQKSLSKERTFSEDTNDFDFLNSVLIKLTEQLAYELRQDGKICSTVAIKYRFANFETFTKQKSIAYAANDKTLIAAVKELFSSIYNAKEKYRLIGVKFSNLINGTEQFDLFGLNQEQLNLNKAMDAIRLKFGKNAVQRAVGTNKK